MVNGNVMKDGTIIQAQSPSGKMTLPIPASNTIIPRSERRKKEKRRLQDDLTANESESNNSIPTGPPAKRIKSTTTTTASPNLQSNLIHDSTGVLDDLTKSYNVITAMIGSGSKIAKKATKVIETVGAFSFVTVPGAPPPKPNVILLYAKGPVAQKLISIVEISKREIARTGGKWYQYTVVEDTLVVQERQRKVVENSEMDVDGKEEAELSHVEDEHEFEVMKTPLERAIEGKPKVRAVPVMSIYLSRVRIEKLKTAYGEQTNSLTPRAA